MICPGCYQPAPALFATSAGDRCATCKSKLVELPPPPVEKKVPRYKESRAGRAKVIRLVEEQVWGDIRKVLKSDPKLRNQFNKGQVIAYQNTITYLSKYKTVSGKDNGTEKED